MTVIRLDAATLAQFQAGGPIYVAGEDGNPVLRCLILPADSLDREPELTEEEWDAIENDPEEMTTEEVLAHLRSLESR